MLLLVHEGHASARRFFTLANAASYDALVRISTFGRDSAWKRAIVQAAGERNSVLELACGTGILSSMLEQAGKSVTGLDLTFGYLAVAGRKLQLSAVQGTGEVLPYRDDCFDAVVSSYLAKYVDIERTVSECKRVLRPGGALVFHDFTYPSNSAMQGLWNAYFYVLRAAGVFAPSWRAVFEQLDSIVRESRWVDQTQDALQKKGFQNIVCRYHTAGTAAVVAAEKGLDG